MIYHFAKDSFLSMSRFLTEGAAKFLSMFFNLWSSGGQTIMPSSHHIILKIVEVQEYFEWHSKLSISHTKSIAENWVPLDTALLLQHYSIAQGEEEAEKKEDENILAQLQKRELNFNFRYRKQPPIQIVYGAKGRRNRGTRWTLGIP